MAALAPVLVALGALPAMPSRQDQNLFRTATGAPQWNGPTINMFTTSTHCTMHACIAMAAHSLMAVPGPCTLLISAGMRHQGPRPVPCTQCGPIPRHCHVLALTPHVRSCKICMKVLLTCKATISGTQKGRSLLEGRSQVKICVILTGRQTQVKVLGKMTHQE